MSEFDITTSSPVAAAATAGLRRFAAELVETLGAEGATAACRRNHWHGALEVIETMRAEGGAGAVRRTAPLRAA